LALVMALSLTACSVEQVDSQENIDSSGAPAGENTPAPAGDREVNVYSWGEYIDESLIDEFEAQTGITVNYRTVPSNEELYSLLSQGSISPDVIVPSDYMISQLIEEDMLQPLDYAKIPN